MMKSLLLWISLSVLGSSAVRAEDPPAGPLDVDAAVRLALNQNYVYRRAQAGVERACDHLRAIDAQLRIHGLHGKCHALL